MCICIINCVICIYHVFTNGWSVQSSLDGSNPADCAPGESQSRRTQAYYHYYYHYYQYYYNNTYYDYYYYYHYCYDYRAALASSALSVVRVRHAGREASAGKCWDSTSRKGTGIIYKHTHRDNICMCVYIYIYIYIYPEVPPILFQYITHVFCSTY